MLKGIQKELHQLVDRSLDRNLRIAVTGLSRSGKTAFITSLINQLLHCNQHHHQHLPLFDVARQGRIMAVKRISQQDLTIPRFDYEANLSDLYANPPRWCQSTKGVSETRLAIRYRPQGSLLRHIKHYATLYLDIFDYPGEWLLDLPLLGLNFQQWSKQSQQLLTGTRLKLAQNWLAELKNLDLLAQADEDKLAQIAQTYSQYLQACKQAGMQFIQPGRFVLPGELDGAPILQFFPLVQVSEQDWAMLKKNARANSYFALLNQRYRHYQQKVVKKFYQHYFATFDRQIILADCLTPLNHSQQAFLDMQQGLNQLVKNFRYGRRNLLHRLFAPRIDKLLFVASKADHITSDQIPNLISLMEQLVQESGREAKFEGIEIQFSAISAIRATQQVIVQQNGKAIKAIQGVRSRDKKWVTLYPGHVPAKLPNADFWQNNPFDFDQFEPQPLNIDEVIPHLRMDSLLQFLLGDKVR